MTKSGGAKPSRTSRYLMGRSLAEGCDGAESYKPPPSPPNHRFIPRLCWTSTPKGPYSARKFAEALHGHPHRPLLYCDSSLFDEKTDSRIFDALVAGPGRTIITPGVRRELEPWLAHHEGLPIARAIRNTEGSIEVRTSDCHSGSEASAFRYYVHLLGVRKKILAARLAQFKDENGHACTPDEERKIRMQVNADLGPRGFLLAEKGAKSVGSPNRFTDEALVFSAVADAIRSGRPTILLTKDQDVQEQFYKLIWLLDTQYRGLRLADAYYANPKGFRTIPMPKSPELDLAFEGEGNILVERTDADLRKILPTKFRFVPIQCVLFSGDYVTEMSFGAEMEMGRLLRVKGETHGFNTDKFGARNCYSWLAPLNLPMELRGFGAVGFDRRLPLEGFPETFSTLDLNQAMMTRERFQRLVPMD
jgi:hypothetical protein